MTVTRTRNPRRAAILLRAMRQWCKENPAPSAKSAAATEKAAPRRAA